MRTVEDLVRTEVHYCVSSLVSTLANGTPFGQGDLNDLVEQARELSYPIEDWEEAAGQAGIEQGDGGRWSYQEDWYDTAQEGCEANDIEPYQWEVYEHWIVSDWLADQLAAKGEKVDKDFAGLTVWARTTTGQAIAMDSVIQAITADLAKG